MGVADGGSRGAFAPRKKQLCGGHTFALNRHFFLAAGIFEKSQTGVRWFFLPPRTCPSLFNGPVCCPQCPILNFWAVAALFVKHVFCCWGHHILKKSKWWGMPACTLQLGWPQTSDEQGGAMRRRAWLPLLGTQWPLWPKVCAASQPPELHKAGCLHFF